MRGFISVCINQHGMLQLNLPRWIARNFGKSRLRISLDLPDTPIHRKIAETKAAKINSDIIYHSFDCRSVEEIKLKYGLGIQKPSISAIETLSLDLWEKYRQDKVLVLKPKSIEALTYYTKILAQLENIPHYLVKEKLLGLTSVQVSRKILTYLSACYKWGNRNGLVPGNPYLGKASELPKPDWMVDPKPNPFSTEEKLKILTAFQQKCPFYLPSVQFWFLTGCRPSEALGLRWGSIKKQFIVFQEAIVLCQGKTVITKGSKNNKIRRFPKTEEISAVLYSVKVETGKPLDQLVFLSPRGMAVNYNNFSQRWWAKIVDPIKADTTPYSCRDTFITEQIVKGTPIAVVAKWVDNSVSSIEKYYLKIDDLVQPR